MSLRSKINQGMIEGVLSHLKEQRSKLEDLASGGKMFEFELPILGQRNNYLVLSPFPSEGSIAQSVDAQIMEVLKEYQPEKTDYKGFVAYKVDRSAGKLPKAMQVEVPLSAKLQISLARSGIDIIEESGQTRKPRNYMQTGARSPRPELDQSQWYKGVGETGKTIDIVLHTMTPFNYQLLPVLSKENKVREYFPGYRVPFEIAFDDQKITTWITSAQDKETPKGKEGSGNYMKAGIHKLFEHYSIRKLKEGEQVQPLTVTLEIVKPSKLYRVVSVK